MRIFREATQLLVIDVQSKLFPHIHEHEEIEKNCNILIEGFKVLDLPIVVTEQYTRGLGETIDSLKDHLGDAYNPIEKSTFSCCRDTGIMANIMGNGQQNVVICGIESHVCVLQTVLDLIAYGFRPVVVADCVSSRSAYNKKIALKRMQQAGAILTTYESILFELLQTSGTDEFRAISKLVK